MSQLQIRWHRIFGIYLALATISLLAAALTTPPLQNIFLVTGAALLACFIPLIMAIYFLRGLLRIH